MAATDERAIHEFPTGTIDDNSLLIMDRPTSTPGEYETEKFAIANLGLKLLGGIDFPSNLDTDEQDIFGAINEVNAKAMNTADEYDETASYSKGDYCIYQNSAYRCIKDSGTTTGTFVAADWTQIKVLSEVKANTGAINALNSALSGKTDNTISSLTIESNTKISQQGIHFLLFGKIITLSGVFRAQNTQIMAGETIWTIKNHNLVGLSTDQYYLPLIIDNESGYLYLVAQNDGNDIKIFSNANLQMPRLMFFNGVLPIV